jgi:D-alanine-D-alanine ligase-like ATP-grasp enzyme
MFRLHYHCRSGGDGSVGVKFHKNEKEAIKAEEKDLDVYGEGWGEPSNSHVDLVIKDNKIYRRESKWNSKAEKYDEVLIPLEQVD